MLINSVAFAYIFQSTSRRDSQATTSSLSVDGVSFNASTIVSGPIIRVENGEFNLTNSYAYNFVFSDWFLYGHDAKGYWENNRFENISSATATGGFFYQQTATWTFVNQTFVNVPSKSSLGIIRIGAGTVTDSKFIFGGNISFINCPSIVTGTLDSAISLYHYSPSLAQTIYVQSILGNPSRFIVENSDVNLFLLQSVTASTAPSGPLTSTSIEVGSVYINSARNGSFERYIFAIDPLNPDYPGSVPNRFQRSNITVLNDIVSNGMAIATRGYTTALPNDMVNNPWIKIGGDLNVSHTGLTGSSFLMTWPIDVSAKNIHATMVPRNSDGLVSSFIRFPASSTVAAHCTFNATNDFIISSSTSPYSWEDAMASSNPAAAPTTANDPTAPHSLNPPIYPLTSTNLTLNIIARAFTIANFSLPREIGYNDSYQGAALSVSGSSVSITTTGGDITFSGNQNTAGAGGALFILDDGSSCVLSTTGSGSIVFSDNIAYYGGAVFVEEPSSSGSGIQFSTNSIKFLRNTAIEAGGAALLPHSLVVGLLPATKTVIAGNGAAGFGCVFAFDLTASSSDTNDITCSGSTYPSTPGLFNFRLGSNYTTATQCTQYERLCDVDTSCRPTPNLPIGSVCVNGVYQVTPQSFAAYAGNSSAAPIDAPLLITGNVTISDVLVSNVLQLASGTAMLSSTDCITVSKITVALSEADQSKIASEKKSSALLIQSTCSPQGTNIVAVGAPPKKSCQRTKVQTTATTTTLQATFTISSSKCDVWWIILVSVIGGVLLLVIIAVVVIRAMPSRYRRKCQPFHQSKDAPDLQKPRAYTNVE